MTTEGVVVRLEGKLATVTRHGRSAMVCFLVRGSEDDIAALAKVDGDVIVGIVATHDVATTDSSPAD